MLYPPHIIVTVSLYPSGPRVSPLWLGGTEIQFRYQHSPQDWFCLFFGDEDAMLRPGETTTGGIQMLSPDSHVGQFWVGMPFQLAFGQPAIADGIILEVVDPRMRTPNPLS